MATGLKKLITEYRAIEEIDHQHKQARCKNEDDSTGFRIRMVRRQEILHEILAWIRRARDTLKNDHNSDVRKSS
jgi:hypothetical protein